MPVSQVPLKLFDTATEGRESSKVTGTLPSYIEGGSFIRVGPGKFDFGKDFSLNHWLDGYGLLQRFKINNDDVHFEKKYLESDAYLKSLSSGKPVVSEFATAAPSKGLFSRIISTLVPEFTDNNYSSIFQIGSDLLVSCDTCYFRKVDEQTLQGGEKFDGNKLFHCNGQSAHPLVDSNGDIYNVGFSLLPSAKYTFFKTPLGDCAKDMFKRSKTVASFSSRWTGALSVNHSFAMSENYLLYIEQPVIVSVGRILSSLVQGGTLKEALEWRPEEKNRFIIVEKATGKIFKMEFLSENPFYFMHVVNCYEENNELVVDIISYNSPNMLESLYMSKLRANDQEDVDLSCVQRYIIPLVEDAKLVAENVELLQNRRNDCSAIRRGNRIILRGSNVTERGIEMPTINKSFCGRHYRYAYAAGTFNASDYCHTITKTDLQTGNTVTWKESEFFYPGEPLFVANPRGSDEDDGVLISAITDSRAGFDDYLIFLDAKTMEEIARAEFKSHIPSALHAIFIPQK